MSDTTSTAPDTTSGTKRRAGAFDIRTFIGLLIGIYGVVLVIVGLVDATDAQLDKADGLNINLWAGLGMVVGAGAFLVWARLRPVVVPEHVESADEEQRPAS